MVLGALEEALDVVRRIEQLVLFTLHQLGVHNPIAVIQIMEGKSSSALTLRIDIEARRRMYVVLVFAMNQSAMLQQVRV